MEKKYFSFSHLFLAILLFLSFQLKLISFGLVVKVKLILRFVSNILVLFQFKILTLQSTNFSLFINPLLKVLCIIIPWYFALYHA